MRKSVLDAAQCEFIQVICKTFINSRKFSFDCSYKSDSRWKILMCLMCIPTKYAILDAI